MSLDLESLDKDLRCFVQQYQDGHRTVSALISREALDIKTHITSEIIKSEKSIKQLVSHKITRRDDAMRKHFAAIAKISSTKLSNEMQDQKSEIKESAQKERLLNSLKFSGINERRNQIADAHGSTFHWIFEEEENGVEVTQLADSGAVTKKLIKRWSSFPTWLGSDERVYWINGKPGSGKTTLLNYLMSQPETKTSLGSWMSDVVIISHFFWRPGSPMQHDVKGFLCSLLYQLLLTDTKIINVLLANDHEVASKDSDTDWSYRELRRVLFDVLQQFGKPLCVFIDGVDEIDTQEGIQDLLGILDEMRKVPNLKMCVTSRLEQALCDYFHSCPQLRIHDLTSADLRSYALDSLRAPPNHPSQLSSIEIVIIIAAMVDKADGVFLWLCLAVSSINRGLSNGDDFDTLLERIKSLPADLLDMYKDMWARMNDDRGIYRKKAALYFNLVIAASKVLPEYLTSRIPYSFMSSNMSVLEMRMASLPPNDGFFSFKTAPSAETLIKQCQNTEKSLRICCAGFLEVTEKPVNVEGQENSKFNLENFRPLRPYLIGDRSIRFLHRTAFDFMTDTIEGREILAYDDTPVPLLQLRLLKASLAVRQVCMLGGMRWVCNAGELAKQMTFCHSLELILCDLSQIFDDLEPNESWRAEAYHLIDLLERMYNIVQPFSEKWRQVTGEFLVRAAGFNLGDWVPDKVIERSATDLLKSLLLMGAGGIQFTHRTPSMLRLSRRLLDLGCDPNTDAASFCDVRNLSLLETPTCHFLRTNLFYWASDTIQFLKYFDTMDQYIEQVPKTLDAYITHGADLSRTLLIALEVTSEGVISHRYPLEIWQENSHDDFILMAMPAFFVERAIRTKLATWKTLGVDMDDFKRRTLPSGDKANYDTDVDEDSQDLIDDTVAPVCQVLATMDWDCADGSYCKITKRDSRYLAVAVEAWMGGGLQDILVMKAIHKRLRKVCRRSERSKVGEHLEDLVINKGHAVRRG